MVDAAESGQLPETLQECIQYFSSPDRCHEFMVALRWPDGVTCPTCGEANPRYLPKRRLFECRTRHARQQFSTKVGTIFEDSPLGLDKWLVVVWLVSNCKNGISSYEVARALGVTQKTGWFMLHRARLAMQDGITGGKMGGTVEVDETYIGGKARNMHFDRREATRVGAKSGKGKAVVMGLLERGKDGRKSRVRAISVPNARRRTLRPNIKANVEPGATVFTDQFMSHETLSYSEFEHKVINHAVSYVQGNVHTNGIENFWSLLKRSINGTYVSVEPFHLFRYLDEHAFRFNQREGDDADRFVQTLRQITGRRVMYKDLIAREEEARA